MHLGENILYCRGFFFQLCHQQKRQHNINWMCLINMHRNRHSNGPRKKLWPITCLTFLWIELDTVKQETRLSQEKHNRSLLMINEYPKWGKVTLKEHQSLCGLLHVACSVIVPGRTFWIRLFDLPRGLRKPHTTWLTVKEYMCHKWPRICSICRKNNPALFSFTTYHRVCNKSNTTDAKCGSGTAYSSRAPELISRVLVKFVYLDLLCNVL